MIRALLLTLVVLAAPLPVEGGHLLPAEAAHRATAAGEVTLVDIRLPVEWAETGVPEGAVAIPLQNPLTHGLRPGFVDDLMAAVAGDPDREIALICARGRRSALARTLLEEAGFSAVHDVGEGMLGSASGPGWLARGLPVSAALSGPAAPVRGRSPGPRSRSAAAT